jgi:hypothetical protein
LPDFEKNALMGLGLPPLLPGTSQPTPLERDNTMNISAGRPRPSYTYTPTRLGATPVFMTVDTYTPLKEVNRVLLASTMSRNPDQVERLADQVVGHMRRNPSWQPTIGVAASSKLHEPLTVLLAILARMRDEGLQPTGKKFPKVVCLDLEEVQRTNEDKTLLLGESELEVIRAKGFKVEDVLTLVAEAPRRDKPRFVPNLPQLTGKPSDKLAQQSAQKQEVTSLPASAYMGLHQYQPGLHLVLKPAHRIRAIEKPTLDWSDTMHVEEQRMYKLNEPYASALHLESGSVLNHPAIGQSPFWLANNLLGYLPETPGVIARRLAAQSVPGTRWFFNWSAESKTPLTKAGFKVLHESPDFDPRLRRDDKASPRFQTSYLAEV